MGGNALQDGLTRRFNSDEYFELCHDVTRTLSKYGGFISDHDVIPAYRTKETFGDMDVVYSSYTESPLSVEDVKSMFPESKQIIRNTSVISFEHKEFQIDLIHSKQDQYLYALDYFSYNDCGNLTSKIARRFGLKHGHAGLTLPMRDVDNVFDEISITTDHDAFLDFVGLEKKPFHNGFETLEDMFEWVSSSKYFDPKPYAFENLTAVGRIRDKKRTTYHAFLKWLDQREFNVIPFPEDKSYHLARIFEAFPESLETYKEACHRLALQKYVKTKMNGRMVSVLTGLTDKKLGEFMKELRKDFRMEPETLVYLTETQIVDIIMDKYQQFNQTS